MRRGHRAKRLERVEDVLHVIVHPTAQARLTKRAEGVDVEVCPDRFPDRLREPGHRNRLVHAVDRGQHVGHDHVVKKPHRRGRLIRPDGTADGVAEIERRLERALPQGLGVGQQGPRLRHRHQARALLADQARLLRPVHDQVQARELGGAVEPQALVAGPEQRDQLPGIGGPDVPGRRERPAPRAKPFRESAELADNLAASGRLGEFLRGRQGHRKLGEFPLLARSGPTELPLQAHAPADPRQAPDGPPGDHPGGRSAPRGR